MPKSKHMPLISKAGAYLDIDAEDYHGNINLLPEPSLSSSGAKTIATRSPFHFWWNSPMNPDRPDTEKVHFALGRAAHDLVLLGDRMDDAYYVLPEDFNGAATKKFAEEIAERDAAKGAGKTILRYQDMLAAKHIAAKIEQHPLAQRLLSDGVPEETLVYKDEETGVWLRARPDWRPNSVLSGGDIRIIADLKFMAPSYCSPHGFSRALDNFGYHQSAAFYFDAIKAVYGVEPTHWINIVVEKPEAGTPAHQAACSVSPYQLPYEDIERGRLLNRAAIRTFADCLERDHWPEYADDIVEVGLNTFARDKIDTNSNLGI